MSFVVIMIDTNRPLMCQWYCMLQVCHMCYAECLVRQVAPSSVRHRLVEISQLRCCYKETTFHLVLHRFLCLAFPNPLYVDCPLSFFICILLITTYTYSDCDQSDVRTIK